MSRDTTAAPTAPGRRNSGRHRVGRPAGLRCADLPDVRLRLDARPATSSLLRSLWSSVPSGRHTWESLVRAGGRPRTAFAIILSL